jgi:hypothetical protein
MDVKYNPFKTAHEFETQRSRPLPRNLFAGASPTIGGVSGRDPKGFESPSAANRLDEPWKSLLLGIQRKAEFVPVIGTVGTTAINIRPRESRIYLLVQNTSVANVLYLGIGFAPTTTLAGSTGLILAANGGNYEPSWVPQQDLWLSASAANTQFVVYVAQG